VSLANGHPRRKADLERGEDPPPALEIDPDGIPAELQERRQWVCWRPARRDGKWTKVPVNPNTTRNAKANVPSTWGTFALALSRYQKQPDQYAGIGFEFSADDPYCGVDLDDAVDPDTGRPLPWAQAIIDRLDTYAELSPTGTGVKLYLRGAKPGQRAKEPYQTGAVEIYDRGHFFAMTGHRLPGTPATVNERQAELEAVYAEVFPEKEPPGKAGRQATGGGVPDDEALIRKAMKARNGAKFRALWEGDTSGHGNDDSRADLALCVMLAFWTGKDKARMDRLFRQSGLMRDKWDERHHGDGRTYGEGTLDEAIERCEEIYTPRPRSGWVHAATGGQPGEGPAAGEGGDGPPTMHQMILAYFRERYQPVFRRESALWSATLGRAVRPGEACNSPTWELVKKLATAADAPTANSAPVLDKIPEKFRTWAGVAWQDLLNELPDEPDSAEVTDTAAEEFRRRLTAALTTVIALGHSYRKDGVDVTETQRRALVDWAALWAKPGPWGDVRSYRAWHRLDDGGRLHMALRVDLFAQLGRRELSDMTQRQFARLCELYGLGVAGKAGGERVVILDPDFVAEVRAAPSPTESWTDGRTDGETHARAREDCAQASKSAQGDTAPTDPVDGSVDAASVRPRVRPCAPACGGVGVDGSVDGSTDGVSEGREERPTGEREPGEEG
jgi:hypothetical protein